MQPEEICKRLAAWAEVTHQNTLSIWKSDLLCRLIYAGEMPSLTECPVHKGKWSGCHWGWPGSKNFVRTADGVVEVDAEVDPYLQKWWDAGCRCATHRGSSCTTGWNPDENCGCWERKEG